MVVGAAEQVADRDAAIDDLMPDGVDERAVGGPEDRVAQERFRFGAIVDGVVGGGGAGAEPGDLREDEPHPVAALVAVVDLGEGLGVVVAVAVAEALEVARRWHGIEPKNVRRLWRR